MEGKQVEVVKAQVVGLVQVAQTYTVKSQEQLDLAGQELIRIKTVRKQVDELFDPVIKQAHAAHKEAVASKKKLTEPLDTAEKQIKAAIGQYTMEQERKAREEQERLRIAAEERARKERERIEAQALKAMEKGQEEKAEALLEKAEAVQVMTPIVAQTYQAPSGVSTRKTWKARVIDESKVPAYFAGVLIRPVDGAALNRIASMTKGPSQIPGVEFYEDSVVSARTR